MKEQMKKDVDQLVRITARSFALMKGFNQPMVAVLRLRGKGLMIIPLELISEDKEETALALGEFAKLHRGELEAAYIVAEAWMAEMSPAEMEKRGHDEVRDVPGAVDAFFVNGRSASGEQVMYRALVHTNDAGYKVMDEGKYEEGGETLRDRWLDRVFPR